MARRASWLGALIAAFLWTGCGSSEPLTTATFELRSPGIGANGATRPDVRCGGSGLWIPLRWGRVPPDTEELAIYMGRFKYKQVGGRRRVVVPFAYLASHIDPSSRSHAADAIPAEAKWTFFGPLSCPPNRTGQNILVEVFALDRVKAPRIVGSRLAIRLTEEALRHGYRREEPRSPGELTGDATAIWRLFATYGTPRH